MSAVGPRTRSAGPFEAAHDGWLKATFLDYAIRYSDVELLDALMTREPTYALYLISS